MARRGQPHAKATRGGASAGGSRRRRREDVVSLLARTVREVGSALDNGPATRATRTKFQVVALLLRDQRERLRTDDAGTEPQRAEQLKQLEDIATALARHAVRDRGLLDLLAEDVQATDEARALKRDMLRRVGLEPAIDDAPPPMVEASPAASRPGVVPHSVSSRQLANPFLAPDYSAGRPSSPRPTPLDGWELLGPLLRSFERGGARESTCMQLPEVTARGSVGGRELMPHQAQVVAAAATGHRSFLLADEPGLGKTAQALLAADKAKAYPLLVVAPSVVKTNWVREAALWTPHRSATAVQGDGESVDGFADIVVINYDVLERHVGWLGEFGFRGMVVDEAHLIKNKGSQRSQHVLSLSQRIRSFTTRPLLMALTGTPLINDIEEFLPVWELLGWIDEKAPRAELMDALTRTGLAPDDPEFYAAARRCVIERGIVRRRKIDVAADIPERRIADLPVELTGTVGRSIRRAERDLADKLVARYSDALARRSAPAPVDGIDDDLVRQVATWEQKDAADSSTGDNIFTMMRSIGQAKAGLAADYAAQLARSAGKVVFFARHIDVMDAAERTFAEQGIRFSSIRGDQTPTLRQRNVDAFVGDPDVAVAVCSLTAAGVGINLQVASNVVLAELPWTSAEQTQAIDRSHRIGQSQPVTAWRIIAAQTVDTRVAELIDEKASLAARALDGSDEEVAVSTDAQHATLVAILREALHERSAASRDGG